MAQRQRRHQTEHIYERYSDDEDFDDNLDENSIGFSDNNEPEDDQEAIWIKTETESIQVNRQQNQCDASWKYDVKKLTRDAFFNGDIMKTNVFVELFDKARNAIVHFFRGVRDHMITMVTTINNQIVNISETVREYVVNVIDNTSNGIGSLSTGIGGVILDTTKKVGDVIVNTTKGVGNVIVDTSKRLGDVVVDGANGIKNVAVDTAKKVGDVIVSTAECVGTTVKQVVSTVGNTVASLGKAVSRFFGKLFN